MLEVGIEALLAADSGVIAQVGSRIFPLVLPENLNLECTGTCLTYQDITGESYFTLARNQWAVKRIQFDAWSTSYMAAKNALMAVQRVLDGFVGTLTDGTRVIFANSTIESDKFEDDGRSYRCLAEYEITYVSP